MFRSLDLALMVYRDYRPQMTEVELYHQRAKIWHIDGHPITTLEDAQGFLDSVGFCLMYPIASLPLVPTFIGAYAGSEERLPDGKHAFADSRTQPALDLMVRLLRERRAYEINFSPDTPMIVSAPLFPFFYALVGDRNPKAVPKTKAQGAKVSPLGVKVFEMIQKNGPLSKPRLQELISREFTTAALDRALSELWSILKIIRVDYREGDGAQWDPLYRWSPEVVAEGLKLSVPEALSALLGKYLEAVVVAGQDDIEQLFSYLVSRSKIRDAVHALLAARELDLITIGSKSCIELAPALEPHPPHRRRGSPEIG
jgi:23S rRNA pseudouridine2605 synthase